MKMKAYLLFWTVLWLLGLAAPAAAVLPPSERAQFEKTFVEKVDVNASLSLPEIQRNPLTKECAAVYTIRDVSIQPPEFGLERGDRLHLTYACDEEKHWNGVGSTLPWASPFPGENVWMTVPRAYLKSKSKNVWMLDNSGAVFAPVTRLAEKFRCPDTDFAADLEGPWPSGDVYHDVRNGMRTTATLCSYAKGQYALHIDWIPATPAIDKTITCFNDGMGYGSAKGMEEPFYQVKTYYTREDFGVHIEEKGGAFWIGGADKHSPAFNAGIEAGAGLVALNGRSLPGMTLAQVYELLREAEADKKIVLTLQGGGQAKPRDVTLETEPYDSFGDQILVFGKRRWAKVEIELDPNEPITEEMKKRWIGIARDLLAGLEEQALECLP